MTPTNLVEQLVRDEGERLRPYTDTVGKLTIGVGRNLTDKGISKEESRILLANDIREVEAALKSSLPWTDRLDPVRCAVLKNMGFNMGVDGLLKFKNTLAMIQAGENEAAAKAMLQSLWAKQTGPRATRLSQQVLTGEWQ